MYELMKWGEVADLLRKKTLELQRAPKMEDVLGARELINAIPHGDWKFVLGYCGINPFYYVGKANNERFNTPFLEDMSDEGIIKVLKRRAFAMHCTPREQDIYAYIECIYRWGSWPATLEAAKMKQCDSYRYKDPVPGTVDRFYDTYVRRCRFKKRQRW